MVRRMIPILALAGMLAGADGKPEEQAKFLADGPEKMTVARRCANCHTAGNFTKFRKDEEAWNLVMADMANRGAEIPDEDYDSIVAYLTRNYGPEARLHLNRAPVEEIGKLLALSKQEARSIVSHREANGPFCGLEDLSKVPGLDSKNLESKRSLLVF